MAAARAAQIRVTRANLIPLLPTRSGLLKSPVRLQAGFLCTLHHGPQKDGFEFTAVIGEVNTRPAEAGHDLRHLAAELPILVVERAAITLRLLLHTDGL